jgi:hypothetical protein
MPKPSNDVKPAPPAPAPKLNPLNAKSHRSASGLLGRTGGSGSGLTPPSKPGTPLIAGNASEVANPAKPTGSGHNVPADRGGPGGGSKHPGKPEARRPTGRAISGG